MEPNRPNEVMRKIYFYLSISILFKVLRKIPHCLFKKTRCKFSSLNIFNYVRIDCFVLHKLEHPLFQQFGARISFLFDYRWYQVPSAPISNEIISQKAQMRRNQPLVKHWQRQTDASFQTVATQICFLWLSYNYKNGLIVNPGDGN